MPVDLLDLLTPEKRKAELILIFVMQV